MAKPTISSDTPAIKEIFTDRKNILLSNIADSHDLANKILELKDNEELRVAIANGGYKLYNELAVPQIIVKRLLNDLIIDEIYR